MQARNRLRPGPQAGYRIALETVEYGYRELVAPCQRLKRPTFPRVFGRLPAITLRKSIQRAAVNDDIRVFDFPSDDFCFFQSFTSRRDADIFKSGGIAGGAVQNNAGEIGRAAALCVGQRPVFRFGRDFSR